MMAKIQPFYSNGDTYLYNIIMINMITQVQNTRKLFLRQVKYNQKASKGLIKKKKNKSRGLQKRKFGYWRNSEQLKYIAFLRTHYLIMKNAQLRIEFQIFKKMSTFIKSRNAIQCKSHHQKMLMKNNNELQAIIKEYEAEITKPVPQYLYRLKPNENTMQGLMDKIKTTQQLPHFMIKSPHKLLIVIDQRFIMAY